MSDVLPWLSDGKLPDLLTQVVITGEPLLTAVDIGVADPPEKVRVHAVRVDDGIVLTLYAVPESGSIQQASHQPRGMTLQCQTAALRPSRKGRLAHPPPKPLV